MNDTGPQSENESHVFQSLVVEDIGRFDGVRRVLFATHSNGLWVNYMLFLDAIVHLLGPDVHASPPVTIPWDKTFQELPEHVELRQNAVPHDLLRWLLVDIDDVFLHGSGVAFTVEDAMSIVRAQNQWRRSVPDFKFNLGFCGHFFERADELDKAGYNKLLELRHEFYWFDHLWNHHQAHQLNETELVSLMKHDIPVHSAYAVSPHHSGIYPVLESLYNAWHHVWNLTATSTEHYPRVHTLGPHLGFRFRGVQASPSSSLLRVQPVTVLPRQTCGVYSRFIQLADVPGGQQRIQELVFGGSLFHSILFNPVSIFMTHMTNYKGDRLALYLFDAVFKFVRHWTNLQLLSAPPAQLARLYASRFEFTGANDLPLYADPCSDSRSRAMWPSGWPCGSESLPQLVILGPQKTGSTALLHFLRLHPSLRANHYQFGTTFEELQFFSSDTLYSRGVRWYMDQFEHSLPNQSERVVRFEKSATYFTHHNAPARLHALLPQARLIVLLRNPIERALAWYQHSLAHRDPAAELLTFSELLHLGENMTANQLIDFVRKTRIDRSDINLDNITVVQNLVTVVRRLYHRCLDPGKYAPHLMRWLSYFPASQILPIDADRFAQTPVASLKVVQEFLRLGVILNYSEYIEYNPHKGFFCLRSGRYFPDWPSSRLGKQSCLGSSKGRKYRHLNKLTEVPKLIRIHFAAANEQLRRLWHSQPVWRWWMAKAGAEYPSWVSAVG
ncbi:Bifunctional heparan sulfate N-deacetylase/N-sulfotransferase [Paragonimus heterotremus]|uniref:[heparan sulfate]-glucosamine N-sulfotransferase n=1 Tax=Paragonimus heterotremus TaxID=100268 RepID=A0A8J4WIW4_9TREM|nr:Bifunctional heparan sulfate N-deacetylase/N-sulfotransferase [Paragonimus heterotremus]